jgi:hypothetical protein
MWRIFGGATLIVAGIAAFIEAHSHRPISASVVPGDALTKQQFAEAGVHPGAASGLSQSAYDLLRIGAWALVIFGAVLVAVGLVVYYSTARQRAA